MSRRLVWTLWVLLWVLLAVAFVIVAVLLFGDRSKAKVGQPLGCPPDITAAIAATPAGGTLDVAGCTYTVPGGVTITQPMTLIGGVYEDPTATGTRLAPIVSVHDTHDVTLDRLELVGGGTAPYGYHAALVGQAGIRVTSSANVTISNVWTERTLGDGLTLLAQPGHGPCTNVAVDHLTVTDAGRQGVTPASVTGASFTAVDVVSAADKGFDFESDYPGVGSGNVVITRSTWQGTNIIEAVTGPIALNADIMYGRLLVNDGDGTYPVSVTGGSLTLPAVLHGSPPAGIYLEGGLLNITGTVIARPPSPNPGQPTIASVPGSTITFRP